jgi:hypothetical protein
MPPTEGRYSLVYAYGTAGSDVRRNTTAWWRSCPAQQPSRLPDGEPGAPLYRDNSFAFSAKLQQTCCWPRLLGHNAKVRSKNLHLKVACVRDDSMCRFDEK